MKRAISWLVITAALLLALTGARPQPVAAGTFGHVVCDIVSLGLGCQPFGTGDSSCPITDVGASASNGGSGHSYDYTLTSPCSTVHVHAGYDVNTHDASERLDYNNATLRILWTCTDDPWIAPSGEALTCTRISAALTGSTDGHSTSDIVYASIPISAAPLADISRKALNGQLQNAIKQAQQPPAPSSALPPTPILPDLQLVAVRAVDPQIDPTTNQPLPLADGLTAVYDIVATNLGSRPASPVEISIQVTGSVEFVAMVQTPDGWNCNGTQPIDCTGALGGAGDPVQQLTAVFRIQVRGTQAGVGAITASLDPEGTIAESDETNNSGQVVITVN